MKPLADARASRGGSGSRRALRSRRHVARSRAPHREPRTRRSGRLSRAGLALVAVTGGPRAGARCMARQWPVDAVVTENGAVALLPRGRAARGAGSAPTRRHAARGAIRLARAFDAAAPAIRRSARSPTTLHARVSDVAHRHRRVAARAVRNGGRAIEALARELGVRTFVSSVHLHLTLDPYDKASGTVALLARRFGEDPTAARHRYAFIGDSANDAPASSRFRRASAWPTWRRASRGLSVPPRFVATTTKGAGFAEIADRILELRG